jgi:hypothetical protein
MPLFSRFILDNFRAKKYNFEVNEENMEFQQKQGMVNDL